MKLRQCWNQLKYSKESSRIKENCNHSDSSERPPFNEGLKSSQGIIIIIIIIIRPDLVINKQKRTCRIPIFSVPADHWVKLKECEKKHKNLDLARELKKLWNMKVTVIPIVIGAFDTVIKGLVEGIEDLEIRGWVEKIQTRVLLRLTRIQRRALETWDLWSLKLQWRTTS